VTRRALAWLAGAAGAAFVLSRRLRRAPAPVAAGDPADELRRKLDASRAPEPDPVRPEPEAPALEERRREVHERGRAAIERMHGPDEGGDGQL
jgi:hypothetical protein